MRRIGRWLLHALTVLSLLLCVATVTLWVRSYFGSDLLHARGLHFSWGIIVAHGHVGIATTYLDGRRERPEPFTYTRASLGLDPYATTFRGAGANNRYDMRWGGFRAAYYRVTILTFREFCLPLWAFCLGSCILPLARLTSWYGRRGMGQQGRCAACSYDLTGNVSGICPECGTALPKPEAWRA
jgi:hypothetical protein